MLARQLLRVGGLLLLFLTTSALAQPIPFDYWYGRILGSPLISMSGRGGKYAGERADFQISAGNTGSFRLQAQNLASVQYYPDVESYIDYPGFNGIVRLSPSLRMRVNQLRYSESTWEDEGPPRRTSAGHSDQTEIDLDALYIEDGAVEFDADHSLLMLQPILWPQRAQIVLQTTLLVDDQSEHSHATTRWHPEVIEVDHRDRDMKARSLNSVIRYGLTDRTSLGALLEYRKSRGDYVSRHQEFDSLWYEDHWESFEGESSDRTSRFAWGFCIDHRLSRAMSLNASARQLILRDAETSEDRDALDGFRSMESQSFGTGNEFFLRAAFFMNADSLRYAQVLDNYSHYYGEQLNDGAWLLRTELALMLSRLRYEGWMEERQFTTDGNFSDSLYAAATIRYYPLANCYISVSPAYRAHSEGNRAWPRVAQSARATMTVDLFTYRWTAGGRRSIDWNHVGDLDYLLGPLLRRRDCRAQLVIDFPEWFGSAYGGRRSLLSGVDGDIRYNWTVTGFAAIGFRDNLEGATHALYRRIASSGAPTTAYLNEWRFGGRVTLQLRDQFRLSLGAEQHWLQTTQSGRPADFIDFQQFDFQVNCRL